MRNKFIIFLCLCLLLPALPAAAETRPADNWDSVCLLEGTDVYAVCRGGLWGMADAGGVLLEPAYCSAPEFINGYAVVSRTDPLKDAGLSTEEAYGRLYGLISIEGELVIPAEFDRLDPIYELQTAVVNIGDLFGLMDFEGRRLTPLVYSDAYPVSRGLFAVQSAETGLWQLLDHKGSPVLPDEYCTIMRGAYGNIILLQKEAGDEMTLYVPEEPAQPEESAPAQRGWKKMSRIPGSDELYLVCSGELWGIADRSGRELLEPCFVHEPVFVNGCAVVTPAPPETGGFEAHARLCGLLNTEGVLTIPAEYDSIQIAPDGATVLVEKDGRFGYMTCEGEAITPVQYIRAHSFAGGYAAVALSEYQLDPESENPFRERWGSISLQGEQAIPCAYDALQLSENGLALVRSDGAYSYLNPDGSPAFGLEFRNAQPFEGDYAIVGRYPAPDDPGYDIQSSVQLRYGVINSAGETIVPFVYENLSFAGEGLLCATRDSLCGYLDFSGEWVIEPEYDAAFAFENGLAAVGRRAGSTETLYWGLINAAGDMLLPVEYDDIAVYNGRVHTILNGRRCEYKIQDGKLTEIP